MSRTRILAINVDKVTMQEALDRCLAFLSSFKPNLVVTPNAEMAYAAQQDAELRHIVNTADLSIPDGAGVVLASRILGDPVPQKVAGADLATNLLHAMELRKRGRIFLLGAQPEVVAEAVRRINERFPGVYVAGYRHGFFTPAEEPAIVEEINRANVDVLFVALGVPRQEKWLAKHLPELRVKLAMGVGGTFDVWAGVAKRAPAWMINANLEWLFRVVKFGRYGRSLPPLVKFMFSVVAQRLRGR